MFRIICLLIGYGFGCFQSAYILCRLIGHIDIRTVGSGNAGFTNTTRILGKKVGIAVFIIDILKIILAYIVCSMIFDGDGSFVSGTSLLPGIYAGIGAVLGHNFPCYLGFRGGKGHCLYAWAYALCKLADCYCNIHNRFYNCFNKKVYFSCITYNGFVIPNTYDCYKKYLWVWY